LSLDFSIEEAQKKHNHGGHSQKISCEINVLPCDIFRVIWLIVMPNEPKEGEGAMKNTYPTLRQGAVWAVAFILVIVLAVPALAVKPPGKPSGETVSHKAKQTPPIELGTSGGWGYDLANGYCCGGTLGSLVTRIGVKYILSNFHVFAADVVDGGNNRVAKQGDPIIQPGLIDVGCNANNAQNVAALDSWMDPLNNTNVDAAIAQISVSESGISTVKEDGSILEIGTISDTAVAAFLNQAVKKSGRTTGLTRSKVSGLNATVSVTYDTECAGSARGTATFTGQIMIANRASKFLAGGDSGSLLVEDVATNPRAVGLLFAGSSSVAVANPINEVLDKLNVSMVGVSGTSTTSGTEVSEADVTKAKKAQAKHDLQLKRVPGGVGHGIGIGRSGKVVIKVYVEKDTPEARKAIPDSVDGIPVEIEETGKIVPFPGGCQ
jgi:hypothetical protein